MAADSTISADPTSTAGPITFHPKRAPTGWKRAGAIGYHALFLGLVVMLIADGVTWWTGIPIVLLGLSMGLSATFWIQRRLGRRPSRYDPRDEVVLPSELVDRVVELRARDERSEAFGLLREKTGLDLGDTVRALERIDEVRGARGVR